MGAKEGGADRHRTRLLVLSQMGIFADVGPMQCFISTHVSKTHSTHSYARSCALTSLPLTHAADPARLPVRPQREPALVPIVRGQRADREGHPHQAQDRRHQGRRDRDRESPPLDPWWRRWWGVWRHALRHVADSHWLVGSCSSRLGRSGKTTWVRCQCRRRV